MGDRNLRRDKRYLALLMCQEDLGKHMPHGRRSSAHEKIKILLLLSLPQYISGINYELVVLNPNYTAHSSSIKLTNS